MIKFNTTEEFSSHIVDGETFYYINDTEVTPEVYRERLKAFKQRQIDLRYLRMAHIWAENSYAQKLQVGALIVKNRSIISDGYNGTPSGFDNTCEYLLPDGSLKTYPEVLHAEANAILKLSRSTNSAEGSTLYVTDSPCFNCAKLIIQAGILRVVYNRQYRLNDGIELLKKAGIEVVQLDIDLV